MCGGLLSQTMLKYASRGGSEPNQRVKPDSINKAPNPCFEGKRFRAKSVCLSLLQLFSLLQYRLRVMWPYSLTWTLRVRLQENHFVFRNYHQYDTLYTTPPPHTHTLCIFKSCHDNGTTLFVRQCHSNTRYTSQIATRGSS